jgi:hypothetical protein
MTEHDGAPPQRIVQRNREFTQALALECGASLRSSSQAVLNPKPF